MGAHPQPDVGRRRCKPSVVTAASLALGSIAAGLWTQLRGAPASRVWLGSATSQVGDAARNTSEATAPGETGIDAPSRQDAEVAASSRPLSAPSEASRASGWEAVGLSPEDAARVKDQFLSTAGGREQLCNYFGWTPRSDDERPRIFFCTVVGNRGQEDVYEILFAEVYPFVHSIVVVDPSFTQQGHERNYSLDPSEPRWSRYSDKLRYMRLENPIAGGHISRLNESQKAFLERPGHHKINDGFLLEQWTRAQLARGLKSKDGGWLTRPGDIVVVADSDEVPLRRTLLALTECEGSVFARVRQSLSDGKDKTSVCKSNSKVAFRSQVFEYYMDCPTTKPLWTHPDAIYAACIMEGGVDVEDLRTGFWGAPTNVIAARHIHNFGMSNEDVVFKYVHYVEPRASVDAGRDALTNDEMRWRGCDDRSPELGQCGWHMSVKPSNDYHRGENKRGWALPLDKREDVGVPFALLSAKPELMSKILWRGHGETVNAYVGKPAGPYCWNETTHHMVHQAE